jgi:cellulose synthase/poly-beta-1,6-N-acetylglucosamine synthase-like glycosyltransferase
VNTPSSLAIVFWFCCGLVLFAYAGYPGIIFTLSRLFGRKPLPPRVNESNLPVISLLIAAHNEEVDIEARIQNCLSLIYPPSKLEIAIASDGSTDRTNELVRKYFDRGVKLFAFEKNRGKAAVLNDTVCQLRGDIVILSDANTHMAPDAATRLASWFTDADVGVVCGRLVLTDTHSGRNVDGLYWKYETFLKRCESRLGALLGSNGAIYAIRKNLFPNVKPGTLIDDFVIPLEAKRQSRCRIVYDTSAVAYEETAPTVLAEFRRRVRIGAGGFQSIGILWQLLSPTHGWVALTFFCHKILRWACPFLLIGMLLSSMMLVMQGTYAWSLWLQLMFYTFAFLGNWAVPNNPRFLRLLRLPTMFTTMNLALLFGFFRWLKGGNTGIWTRTNRSGELAFGAKVISQPVGTD